MNIDLWNVTGIVHKMPTQSRWRFHIFYDKIPEGSIEGFASKQIDYSAKPPKEIWFIEFYHKDNDLKKEMSVIISNWLDMHYARFQNLKEDQRVVIKLKKD